MTYSAEINIYHDEIEGLRIDCSEKGMPALHKYLESNGFSVDATRVAIQGTNNISNLLESSVSGKSYEEFRETIIVFLNSLGVNNKESQFNSSEDKHSRFDLIDISVFDK
ncbi:hypothetical protein ACMXYQ_15985 [Neptuniibacter sp. PT34_22]|uniref:hypothetical protein n=1 Tax=Neptuniibacter sp. PT34_22 TaxID=3398205 RepID=UPI0039F4FE19